MPKKFWRNISEKNKKNQKRGERACAYNVSDKFSSSKKYKYIVQRFRHIFIVIFDKFNLWQQLSCDKSVLIICVPYLLLGWCNWHLIWCILYFKCYIWQNLFCSLTADCCDLYVCICDKYEKHIQNLRIFLAIGYHWVLATAKSRERIFQFYSLTGDCCDLSPCVNSRNLLHLLSARHTLIRLFWGVNSHQLHRRLQNNPN